MIHILMACMIYILCMGKPIDLNWRGKYNNLDEFYKKEFNSDYYQFTRYELDIDTSETIDEINAYSADRIRTEYTKCTMDFFYFAHKYVKVLHPKRGLVPFICYKYQHKVVKYFEEKRFTLTRKFRQAGL